MVAEAEGLVFVAPVFWMGLPAIIKGWVERVFTYGFAYTLTPEGWRGRPQREGAAAHPGEGTDRHPDLLHQGRSTTSGWRGAMDTVLCDWSLKMAGVKEAHHAYFYTALSVSDEKRREYLQDAYRLGRDY